MYFHALPKGRRETKFAALAMLSTEGPDWQPGPSRWREAFFPEPEGAWADFPHLADLFDYNGSGVMPGRTWVIAPDRETLAQRWTRLVGERDPARKEVLFHPHMPRGELGDKHTHKRPSGGLPGHEVRLIPVSDDAGAVAAPVRYGFRSLDRQCLISDARLLNRPNPTLWGAASARQIFLSGLEAHSPDSGPAISISAAIPD